MASQHAPGSTASLRSANRRRVLDVLRNTSGDRDGVPVLTQAELARTTGLAPATISTIVRELADAQLIDTVPGSGRRGTSVQLARSAGLVAAADFGHSHISVALGDLTGTLIDDMREPLPDACDHRAGIARARQMLEVVLTRCGHEMSDVRRVGLGLSAPMTDNVVRSASILPGWVGVDALVAAQDAFGTPTEIENDANLGALAEHQRGVARGYDSSVFVKVSSGVGAGIIVNNALLRGAGGTAGEIGHLTLDEQGAVCRCGSRGCLEAYGSVRTVQAMLAQQLPEASLDDIVDAARGGNWAAARALEDAGLHLGRGIASIVNLINPAVVVIGGEMARAGELLLDSVRTGLRRHALDSVVGTPVLTSGFGERASLIGAIILASERTELLGS